MTESATPVQPVPTPEEQAAKREREAALKEAGIEVGKAIAIGLVPYLGQAIDVYDTIESLWVLHAAKTAQGEEDAKFDLVLAVIGWIPGPGDGVKKTLRLADKQPQRYGPLLFDLLRKVLEVCEIKTSPEVLLDELFNAENLKKSITKIRAAIEDSSGFKSLSESHKDTLRQGMIVLQTELPAMIAIVERRVKKLRKVQPNSAAVAPTGGQKKQTKPGNKSAETGSQGNNRPAGGGANDGIRAKLATMGLDQLTNEMVGISGEHIADYICVEEFKWGEDWKAHDKGGSGTWTKGDPSKTKLGKLSKGGVPKERHILYKLRDGANGTGIDAVWRAEGNNRGKPYAIVEAKATKNEDAPKFLRKPKNTRMPNINNTLGENVISDPSELIEPLEEEGQQKPTPPDPPARSQRKRNAAQRGTTKKPAPTPSPAKKPATKNKVTEVLVQMSHEWIRSNIERAVLKGIALEFLEFGKVIYSRHLFYAPAYHESLSPAMHMKAKLGKLPPSAHDKHDAFHYDEDHVRKAVNKRKASLRKKYGDLLSLKEDT